MIIQVLVGLLLFLNPSIVDSNVSQSLVVAAGESFNESVTNPLEISQLIPGNDINTEYVFTKYILDLSVWNEKEDKNCEKLAKIAQAKYGGSLIFLIGKDEQGNYIKGDYAGHFLNKIYDRDLKRYLYIDYQLMMFDYSPGWHAEVFRKVNEYSSVDVFDLEEGRPPFSMKWHY